jgi:hypothetical protein
MRPARLLSLFLLGALWSACPTPAPPTGVVQCNAQRQCPRGYDCGPGNRCFLAGQIPTGDMNEGFDLAGVDPVRLNLCEDLCICLKTTCDGIGGTAAGDDDDTGSCINTCVANMEQELECRREHCVVLAKMMPLPHCFHARGKLATGETTVTCK